MILNQDNSMVLMVDVQEKLVNAVFNKEQVIKNAGIITKAASILCLPLFVTEQYPQGLGETIEDFKEGAEEIFIKTSFSALEDAKLVAKLHNMEKKQVIVFGIETHICVHQTVATLLKAGFEVTVVSNACGSRSEYEYQLGLENMKQNGAKIKSAEMILFELLKGAKHPCFKDIQALIK